MVYSTLSEYLSICLGIPNDPSRKDWHTETNCLSASLSRCLGIVLQLIDFYHRLLQFTIQSDYLKKWNEEISKTLNDRYVFSVHQNFKMLFVKFFTQLAQEMSSLSTGELLFFFSLSFVLNLIWMKNIFVVTLELLLKFFR